MLVSGWLQNKSYHDEISCCCPVMRMTVCVCVFVCVAEMSPQVHSMCLQEHLIDKGKLSCFSFSADKFIFSPFLYKNIVLKYFKEIKAHFISLYGKANLKTT